MTATLKEGTGVTAAEPPASRHELRAALAQPRPVRPRPLGELLTSAGSVSDTGIRRGLIAQTNEPDTRLGELLLKAGEVHADELYRALGEQLGITYVRLSEFDIEPAARNAVSAELIRNLRVLPLMFNEGGLVVASADPTNNETLAVLRAQTHKPVEMVLANPSELEEAISALGSGTSGDSALNAEHILEQQHNPVARLIEGMLRSAVQRGASDIHLRPTESSGEIRYRIDGSLVNGGEFELTLFPAVVAHIRALANLDTNEHRRLPQDGALHFNSSRGPVNMRISVMPAAYGTNIAIRILDPGAGLRRLSELGLKEQDQRRFADFLDRKQGLVLVAGPVGSGKTTTLYAALQELNTGEYNILTVEDPVEYRLDGVVQVQAQAAANFDFAQALRPILRHDPDVIMVGEISDPETAKIAIESAMTGHLVLSAIHTSSAAQAVRRLVEMGIPSYLVNATLAGVLAQRLVRRNCEHCKIEENVRDVVRTTLGVGQSEVFWRGRGCDACSGTGYRGRATVYELLEMSPQLRELVAAGASHEQLEARAVEEGMVRLTLQALALARSGAVSLSEVFRARVE